jgi:hypothetical protein
MRQHDGEKGRTLTRREEERRKKAASLRLKQMEAISCGGKQGSCCEAKKRLYFSRNLRIVGSRRQVQVEYILGRGERVTRRD